MKRMLTYPEFVIFWEEVLTYINLILRHILTFNIKNILIFNIYYLNVISDTCYKEMDDWTTEIDSLHLCYGLEEKDMLAVFFIHLKRNKE